MRVVCRQGVQKPPRRPTCSFALPHAPWKACPAARKQSSFFARAVAVDRSQPLPLPHSRCHHPYC